MVGTSTTREHVIANNDKDREDYRVEISYETEASTTYVHHDDTHTQDKP